MNTQVLDNQDQQFNTDCNINNVNDYIDSYRNKNTGDNINSSTSITAMLSEFKPILLTEEQKSNVLRFLRNKLSGGSSGKIIFRRVYKIHTDKYPKSIKKYISLDEYEDINLKQLQSMTENEVKQYVEIKYQSFYGFAHTRQIRDEPEEVRGKQIYFHSCNYKEFDFTNTYSFDLSDMKIFDRKITPVTDDLICLWLSSSTIKNAKTSKKPPRADAWFTASDQFLRMWTLINYDWHETLDLIIPKNMREDENITTATKIEFIRKKLFCGNKLMTNSWLKHKQASSQNEIEDLPKDESIKKYWHHRFELSSKYYVDILCALVLISIYGELPTPNNIPNNNNGSAQRRKWDLPPCFVSGLLSKCNIGNLSSISPGGGNPSKISSLVGIDEWKTYINDRCYHGIKTNILHDKIEGVGIVDIVATLFSEKNNATNTLKTENNAVLHNINSLEISSKERTDSINSIGILSWGYNTAKNNDVLSPRKVYTSYEERRYPNNPKTHSSKPNKKRNLKPISIEELPADLQDETTKTHTQVFEIENHNNIEIEAKITINDELLPMGLVSNSSDKNSSWLNIAKNGHKLSKETFTSTGNNEETISKITVSIDLTTA